MSPTLYSGLHPSNVNKDAKYSVVTGPSGVMEVRLVYNLGRGERALLTTEHHGELVEMVNRTKVALGGQPGGAFYINEYMHVLVPSTTAAGCFYAGTYEKSLRFAFDDKVLEAKAPEGLAPGQPWAGPHVGIKYTLNARGNDIYFRKATKWGDKQVFLSESCGSQAKAQELAQRLAQVKGSGGGFYINEAGELFAPVPTAGSLEYLYLGHLEDSTWFPVPEVPEGLGAV